MSRAIYCVMLSVLWFIQAASAQEPISAQDPNRPQSEATTRTTPGVEVMGRVAAQAMASHKASDPPLCAVVVLPGPADSFTIRLGVFNVSAHSLDTLILDSFRALGGQALLHQSVFDTIAPPSGTLTVHYPPDEAGNGPVVLGFTEFTQFKSAVFSTDPDTYEDPDFGATVQDMDKTVIEAVYSDGLRCSGILKFKAALNASIANVAQVFP